jgi:hypothetical protein
MFRDEDVIETLGYILNEFLYKRKTMFPMKTYEDGVLEALLWVTDEENEYESLDELIKAARAWYRRKDK